MSNYALIKGGIVENVVVWNGEGDIFDGYTTYEVSDDETVAPGDIADQDSSGKWTFIAPETVLTPEEQAASNLQNAQSEYDRASDKITALNQQIEDDDYTGTTEDAVKTSLTAWTTYRKSLRAYISVGDGSVTLPTAPAE